MAEVRTAVAVGVAVVVRGGVGVGHDDVEAAAAVFFFVLLVAGRGGEQTDGVLLILRRLPRIAVLLLVLPLVELGADEVNDEGSQGRDHGEEAREGERRPGEAGEAGIGQRLLRIGEDVDESRGEDDAGGEGLGDDEGARFRSEESPARSHQRKRHSGDARDEDNRDGDHLQPQRCLVVPAFRRLAAAGRALLVPQGLGHLVDQAPCSGTGK